MTMKEAILRYTEEVGGSVTFVELSRNIPGFEGEYAFEVKGGRVFWSGVSDEGITALQELIKNDELVVKPVSPLAYFIDGRYLALPLGKTLKKPYKRPHWFPVVFSLPGQESITY